MTRRTVVVWSLLLSTTALGAASSSGDYSIDWATLDCGGGRSDGGPFSVHGTIGQHDADGPLAAGPFVVHGGFWAGGASSSTCPGDCGDGDGQVDVDDLIAVLSAWGIAGPCDIDGDGINDVDDLIHILANWGLCP